MRQFGVVILAAMAACVLAKPQTRALCDMTKAEFIAKADTDMGLGYGADPSHTFCSWCPYNDECTQRKKRGVCDMTKEEFMAKADTDMGLGYGADPSHTFCAWCPYNDECTQRKKRGVCDMTKEEFMAK